MVPIIHGHVPNGAAVKQLFHYGQLIKSHRFRKFDYGVERNLKIYQRKTPPDYSLKNCTAKVAIFYADKDELVPVTDIQRLPAELPNVIKFHRVDDDIFNHVDFIWATDAKELVYNYLIDWMKDVESTEN